MTSGRKRGIRMGRKIDVDDAVKAIMAWAVQKRDPLVTGVSLGICFLLDDEDFIPTAEVENTWVKKEES